jgi:hypothetical protein
MQGWYPQGGKKPGGQRESADSMKKSTLPLDGCAWFAINLKI